MSFDNWNFADTTITTAIMGHVIEGFFISELILIIIMMIIIIIIIIIVFSMSFYSFLLQIGEFCTLFVGLSSHDQVMQHVSVD